MILHFVTAFLLQEINASQEKSQRKSNSPSQTGKVPEGRIGLITDGRSPVIRFLMIHFRRAALGFTVFSSLVRSPGFSNSLLPYLPPNQKKHLHYLFLYFFDRINI